MSIEVKSLCFSYGSIPVLKKVNLTTGEGELIALLGPNGVGKTTLFKCLLGFLKPSAGSILINDKSINSYQRKCLAKEIAYIPQSYRPAFDLSVIDNVLMGLTSHLGIFEQPSKEDKDLALNTLNELGIGQLANKGSLKISGGERQLMLIARALVQKANVLIMDEPTANLDYGNSFRIMQRLVSLKEQGYTVLFSTHDPQQALRHASRVVSMFNGTILSDGVPIEEINAPLLKKLYALDVNVNTQMRVCTPL